MLVPRHFRLTPRTNTRKKIGSPGAPLRVGKPVVLFENNLLVGGMAFGRNFDIFPDGKRFLMITTTPPPAAPTEYRVIVNWAEELKKLVPGG